MTAPTFPEHNKLSAVREQSQAIGEFLEWAESERGLKLCSLAGDELYWPTFTRTNTLLAEFFGIDEEKLEAEKRQMLADLRKLNADPV